jgi:hypothetical protein
MFKKSVIFLFLATAYTILLAHSFTPHEHHTKHSTHHHQHTHHDDEDDASKKTSFYFFQHIGEAGIEYTSSQFFNYDTEKKTAENTFEKIVVIFLDHLEKPPLIVPIKRTEHPPIQQSLPYFFGAKAPPIFIA